MYAQKSARRVSIPRKPTPRKTLCFGVISWALLGALVFGLSLLLAPQDEQLRRAFEAQTAVTRAVEASVAGGEQLTKLATQTDPGLIDLLLRSTVAGAGELTENIYGAMKSAGDTLRPIRGAISHANSVGTALFVQHEWTLDRAGSADETTLRQQYIDAFDEPVIEHLERAVAGVRDGEQILQAVKTGLESAVTQIRKQIAAIAAQKKKSEPQDARRDKPGWRVPEPGSPLSEADVVTVARVISTVNNLSRSLATLVQQAEKARAAIQGFRAPQPGRGQTRMHGFSGHTTRARKQLKKLGYALLTSVLESS